MKVSVITASFNSASTLRDTIESVLSQNHSDIEYILIDGGSTDGTIEIIKSYESKISKWVSERDNGIYDALNKGIQLSSGDVVGFLHADDVFADADVIGRMVTGLRESNADAVYSDLVYVGATDLSKVVRYWKSRPYKDGLFEQGWMPPHPTLYAIRSIYMEIGLFDTSLRISADYEFMLRAIRCRAIKVHYIPSVTVRMRVGGVSNSSLRNRLRANREDRAAWRMNGLRMPFYTAILKPLSKLTQFLGN